MNMEKIMKNGCHREVANTGQLDKINTQCHREPLKRMKKPTNHVAGKEYLEKRKFVVAKQSPDTFFVS